MTVKKRLRRSSSIAKAKYVVETYYDNGNVFLHGPFNSRTKADEFCNEIELDNWTSRLDRGHNPIPTHKIRAIIHPTKWTKAVK